jgi:hypothetical protein
MSVHALDVLDDSPMSIKARIAVLWGSATLLYLYGDVIAFYSPGGLQRMLDGKMGPWPVTPTLLLGVAILMSAPAVMVALTVLLKPVFNRWLNVVMGAVYTSIMLFTMIEAVEIRLPFYLYLVSSKCSHAAHRVVCVDVAEAGCLSYFSSFCARLCLR